MIKAGIGYDIHPLVEGRKLVLGGVMIEHPKGLGGHSDADVLTHSICDALLGCLGEGDIGIHFPDADERYRGESSINFLLTIKKMIDKKGYSVGNIDSVIIAEKPRLAPYLEQMKAKISDALQISAEKINVKATTHEHLGVIGKEEAIAAYSVALLEKKGSTNER